MVHDRTEYEDNITLPSATSSKICNLLSRACSHIRAGLYSYDGVILEVNEASQVVAVMLF